MAKKKTKKEQGVARQGGSGIPAVKQQLGIATGAGLCDNVLTEASAAASAEVLTEASAETLGHTPGKADAGEASTPKETRQQLYADVRAQREARRARSSAPTGGEAPAGYVRRSSLYLSVVLALVAGLFVGSLLPGLAGHDLSSSSSPAGSPPASQAQSASKDDTATRLAGHILELEEAVRKNPNDVAAWVQLGNLYFDSGKAPQSINAYERALLLKPDDANVLTDLGIMYREVGKYEQAVQSFRNASKVDPRHQNALFNRGVVLFFDLKRKEEGRKVWQELLALNPQAKAPDGRPLKEMLRDLK